MDPSHQQSDIAALEQAVAFVTADAAKPNSKQVVDALIAAERKAKRQKEKYAFEQFLGCWRLGFITGTQKTRQRAGVALGAGRFLPPWVQIQITYTAEPLTADVPDVFVSALDRTSDDRTADNAASEEVSTDAVNSAPNLNSGQDGRNQGTVLNTVKLGGLKFSLSGPVRFWPKQNILAFDFTRITVQLFGKPLVKNKIRQGEERERQFYQQNLKEQAFFTYFWVQDDCIAARGRGGGLAFWTRIQDSSYPTP